MLAKVYPLMVKQLTQKVIFNTKKSKRQNTPRLFKNPKLTPYGLIKRQPKNYAYQLPEDLPNRELYWDYKEQNQIARLSMRISRLRKLKVPPIHTHQGVRTYKRTLPQILWELTDLTVLKESLGRTLQNLREVLYRFESECKQQEKPIIQYAIRQIHERNLPSMDFYQFATFCQIRYIAGIEPTEKLMVHFYAQMDKAHRQKKDNIKLKIFTKTAHYIFSKDYSDEYKELLWNQKIHLKLFQDNPPQIKALQTITPEIYSAAKIEHMRKQAQTQELIMMLQRVPGGVQLAEKLK